MVGQILRFHILCKSVLIFYLDSQVSSCPRHLLANTHKKNFTMRLTLVLKRCDSGFIAETDVSKNIQIYRRGELSKDIDTRDVCQTSVASVSV